MTTRRPGHFHAVKFYDSSEALGRIAAEFLGEGLASQQRALVIVTPRHRKRILAELHARLFDVKALEADGDLVLLDADAMLGSFMVGGRPDANLFQANAARVFDRLGSRPIRCYGEGVDVLWKTGLDDAALRLEDMWNRLTATRDIKTLCAYSVTNFYKDTSLRAIFDEHSHVVSDKGALVHAHPTVRWGSPAASQRPS
jgi:MEDS: MEthanogen/methylotroph, DcmR Sensory domain